MSAAASGKDHGNVLPEVRKGRPEAAAAIWNWRAASAVEVPPKTSAIRVWGAVKALASGAIGLLVYSYVSSLAGTLVLAFSLLMLIAALLFPTSLYGMIERGVTALAIRLGRLMNWILLPAVFYGLFVPLGKALRTGKRDRLQRFSDASRASYWSERTGERVASARRDRQY